ncbi:hypothetical protein F900_00404 [Acinetobacter modestus]|uniref:Uncharacterized protein n=1 Tax=Acinetobacter modestus TaxID=1776740 RepID=N9M7B6_9GAMM|nr:hypothetical protein [Acinetobacter modestus]ENX04414.1 hypothetical protein F900_00404 [Acinetobacter modestus]
MKKLSKFTRLPFIPEMNQDSVLYTIIFLICFPLAPLFLSLEKKNLFFWMLLAYYLISIYAPRLMVAKDLIFRNFIEFRGEMTDSFPSEHSNYSTEIKISTQEKINQDVSKNFLIITPNETCRTYFYQRLFSSQIHKFLLDDFINQPVIFRSFQHSAFIFDLGLTVKAQSGREIHFFLNHVELINKNLEKIRLQYKEIKNIQHHLDIETQIHSFKLKFQYTDDISFSCNQTQYLMIDQILTAAKIDF